MTHASASSPTSASRRGFHPFVLSILGLGAVLLFQGLGASASAAPADLARGKALFTKTCVTCHGDQAQGKRDIHSPALHTQESWYLVAQLTKFRLGLRGTNPKDITGATMRPIAQSLPDEQGLTDLAAYISAIEGPRAVNEVEGNVTAGSATFKKICASCHGDNAKGKPDIKSPALVGQSDWYLVDQLNKFKQGLRGYDAKDIQGAQMRAIASTLTTDQMVKDVAAYIASLK